MEQPPNEGARLEALRDYRILDTPPDAAMDRITRLASLLCQTPISLVTLLDQNRQWFKSNVGMPADETPRRVAFCNYVVADGSPLEVPDATLDERFRQNPLVTQDPAIRFYVGYPLTDPDGYTLGSLCVIDQQPRQLSPLQHKTLQLLSQTVMDLILERRNQQRQQQFDHLFVQANDLVAIASRDGYFKTVNPAFERILGWPTDQLLSTQFVTWVHPEDQARTRQTIESLKTGSVEMTHRFRVPDGTYRHLHWVMSREPGTDNRFVIIRDVTAQNQQQEALDQQRRLTQHQAHFITTASHMFRTPLTAMSTSVELARLYVDRLPVSPASQPIGRHLEAITGKINVLDGLIGDTLSLAALEPGPSSVSWTALDLVGLSKSLVLSNFESYCRQGRSVDVRVVGQPMPVGGDERLLESVLVHLLRNAFTYSVGVPHLGLRYEASAVVVEVSDEGIGIPLEDQPYIFDRFFRARNAGDYQGLGLGLAISQEQVNQLGSQLRVESYEGVGTTVRFQLGYASNAEGVRVM